MLAENAFYLDVGLIDLFVLTMAERLKAILICEYLVLSRFDYRLEIQITSVRHGI